MAEAMGCGVSGSMGLCRRCSIRPADFSSARTAVAASFPSHTRPATAGADHLPCFALRGRINAGLAFFHRVPLNASWGRSRIKAVLELELTRADPESVNPEV